MKPRPVAIACALWLIGAAPAASEEPSRVAKAGDSGSDVVEAPRPAANTAAKAKARPAPKKGQSAKAESLTVYVPPSRGAVGARTGGGSRGANPLRVEPLAPDHVGLTLREQPTLAWFLSAETDLPIELTLIADGAVEPSIVLHLPGPHRAGIRRVDLGNARLEPGTNYDWTVALVRDANARDRDIIAGGAIRRAPETVTLARELASGEASYRVLARNGIWYDAIADLSAAIAAAPGDAALHAERAALLEQVGLGAAARYDRMEDPGR